MFWATLAITWFGIGAFIWFALMRAGRRLAPRVPAQADVFVDQMWGGTASIVSDPVTSTVLVRATSTEEALSTSVG